MADSRPKSKEFKGTYGTVKVVDGKVYKTEALYDEDGCLDLSSFCECGLATLVNLMNCTSLPVMEDIEMMPNTVILHMPYYGRTLSAWADSTSRAEKLRVLPTMLKQLVHACDVLLRNDIQHTDIKPANILISDSDNRLVLIDFNIFSVKTIDGWVESVGTWCYVAPEILMKHAPTDTSMSWSIGIIMAECIVGYPLGNMHKRVKDVNNKKDWQELFTKLKIGFDGLPLLPKYYSMMPNAYTDLYNMCTIWDTNKRASISRIAAYLDTTFGRPCSDAHEPSIPVPVTLRVSPFLSDSRSTYIDLIFKFCTLRPYLWNLLYRSIWLYDRFAINDPEAIATCISIAYTFMGYTISNKFVRYLAKTFDLPNLTMTDIEKQMVSMCSQAKWKIYDKAADVIAIERGMTAASITQIIPIVMKARTTEYDGYEIADAVNDYRFRRVCCQPVI